jgi:hypothetical protein
MSTNRVVGVVALVIGIVLLVFGTQSANAPVDQVSSFFTGHFTDQTMLYLIGGIALTVVGGALTLFGRRA